VGQVTEIPEKGRPEQRGCTRPTPDKNGAGFPAGRLGCAAYALEKSGNFPLSQTGIKSYILFE
jgi:hypothetical protein